MSNKHIDVRDWAPPSLLGDAFSEVSDEQDSNANAKPTKLTDDKPSIEKISEHVSSTSTTESSTNGIDPSMLLGLLGSMGQDSSASGGFPMGAVMGLLNGEKPDMLSLLPLLMQMGKKEKKDEPEKVINLDELTVIH